MKKFRAASTLLLLALLSVQVMASNPLAGNSSPKRVSGKEAYQAGRVIIKMKPEFRGFCSSGSISEPKLLSIFARYSASSVTKKFARHMEPAQSRMANGMKPIDLSLIYEVKVAESADIMRLTSALMATGCVAYAEPVYKQFMCFTPNDPSAGGQYQLTKLNAYNAWDVWQGDTNTVIGIVDSGTDWDHPDLQANLKINYADPINGIDDDNDGFIDNYRGWDVSENDNNPMVVNSTHGAHVSGCADAVTNNATGGASSAFNCRFLPVKSCLDASTTSIDNGYDGIVYAADHGANVINLSWGRTGGYSQFENDVIDYAFINQNATVLAAAGNDGVEEDHWPSSYPNCISVAATSASDGKAGFSSYGFAVDVSAPGNNILATEYNDSYGQESGTSMASPIAAGVAAMIKSRWPAFDAAQVGEQLRVTSDNIYAVSGNTPYFGKLGKGRVNLYRALTDSTSPGVVVKQFTATDRVDNIFNAGDTLDITALFKNLLRPTTNLVCTLSTTSTNYVTILQNTFNPGVLGTGDTISNYTSQYRIIISPSTPQNTEISLRVNLIDGTWTDNYSFTITVNVDYINIDVNDVATSVSSRGLFGYNQTGQTQGIGFTYQGSATVLYEMSLMVGANGTQVSDCFRGDAATTDDDFAPTVNISKVVPGVLSDLDASGTFRDNGTTSTSPMNILVSQKEYAWTQAPDNKYIMAKFVIKNIGSTTLTNLYAGIAADWDVPAYANNKASTDAGRRMGYVWSTDGGGLYAAIKLLSHTAGFNHYAIDNYAANGGLDLSDGFSNSEKFTSLNTMRADAGIAQASTGNDVLSVVSTGGVTLAAGDSVEATFALIAGENLSSIQTSADAAQIMYDGVILDVKPIQQSYATTLKGTTRILPISKHASSSLLAVLQRLKSLFTI
ncbi:MAG: S8 family serine peptidase [Bacteroidetes bacterium]|nr:S8 family serine peptidase [Bacteroidota bacterium]